jgi:hypothetical protein
MDDKELEKLLDQLHREMEHVDTIDEKGRELLQDLDIHIHDLLERNKGEQEQTHSSTVIGLEDAIAHLELSHPTLTATLTKFMNVLSSAGI